MSAELSKDEKDGFFDLPKQEICRDPEHRFPTMLYIPPGKGYRHTCPTCGKSQICYGTTATYGTTVKL